MINLRQLLDDFIEQFVELFQSLLIETKFRLIHKNLINLLMNIKIDFRMFLFIYLFISFIFISWRLITLQYCSGFCHTLTWISHEFTCVPLPDPPSHLPLHPIPLGLPSAKPQWGTITSRSGWLLSKSLQAINAGEGVEKREPSYTVGGNAN